MVKINMKTVMIPPYGRQYKWGMAIHLISFNFTHKKTEHISSMTNNILVLSDDSDARTMAAFFCDNECSDICQ